MNESCCQVSRDAYKEALRRAPVDDIIPSANANSHYRVGFWQGAVWQSERKKEPVEVDVVALRRAVAWPITNSDNHPAPNSVMGRDMSKLITAVTDAVVDLLTKDADL